MLTSALFTQMGNMSSAVAVKRGRGRPPGTRNKATLIAQAKMLAQQQAKAKATAEAPQSPLLPATGGGGPAASSTHRVTPQRLLCCRESQSLRQKYATNKHLLARYAVNKITVALI